MARRQNIDFRDRFAGFSGRRKILNRINAPLKNALLCKNAKCPKVLPPFKYPSQNNCTPCSDFEPYQRRTGPPREEMAARCGLGRLAREKGRQGWTGLPGEERAARGGLGRQGKKRPPGVDWAAWRSPGARVHHGAGSHAFQNIFSKKYHHNDYFLRWPEIASPSF